MRYHYWKTVKPFLFMMFLAFPTYGVTTRYVNVNSTGGNGTTTATSGANAAFASLSAAVDDFEGQTLTGSWQIICHAALADTDKVLCGCALPTGASETNYLEISSDNDTVKYQLKATSGAHLFTNSMRWIRFKNIKFISYADKSGYYSGMGTGDIRFHGCVFSDSADANSYCAVQYNSDENNVTFTACAFIGRGAVGYKDGTCITANGGSGCVTKIYNCFSTRHYKMLQRSYGTAEIKNCGTYGDVTLFAGGGTVTVNANDSSAAGTPSFVNAASGDYRIKSDDAVWQSNGVDLSGTFTTDFNGATITDWPIGLNQPAAGCTPATITRSANVTADLGDAGKWGHAITGTADSTKIIGTNADSVAMLAKATKDTVAYRGKVKGRFYIALAQFSCASKDSAYCKDSLIVVGDSVKYANRTDTAYISGYFAPTNAFLMSDSVTVKGSLPSGYALTKSGANMGRITYTAPPDTGHNTITLICWNNGFKIDSGSFTATIIYGDISISAVNLDTAYCGDTVKVYGHNFGVSKDSIHVALKDSTPLVTYCVNDTIKFIEPCFKITDTGMVDLTVHDGTTATKTSAYYIGVVPQCTLTVQHSTGGTTTPASQDIRACGSAVSIAATAATEPSGYAFTKWTRQNAANETVADSTQASTTATLSASDTVKAWFTCTPATVYRVRNNNSLNTGLKISIP